MRARGIIRVFRTVSVRQQSQMIYPTLHILVHGKDGAFYGVPTIAEALVHLWSTEGLKIVIAEHLPTVKWSWPDGQYPTKVGHGASTITLERSGNKVVLVEARTEPMPDDEDVVFDYTVDQSFELVGRSKMISLDLEMDGLS